MAIKDELNAEYREMARIIVKEVLKEHIDSCPHGKALLSYRYMAVGICIGTSLASFTGSSLAIGLAKMLF